MTIPAQPPPALSYSRLAGAALGTMTGDALGMPVEGWPADRISRVHGRLDRMLKGRLPAGSYTDDSQMMIAILETLAQRGELDPACLAGRFLARFQPHRGYGGRIHGVMERLRRGVPWNQAGTDSYGNGGAMRVGVLGAFYSDDLDRLLAAALDQCRITHRHPQGLAGAAAQALGVGLACRWGARGRKPAARELVEELASRVEGIDPFLAGRLRDMPRLPAGDFAGACRALHLAYGCDVTAAEAVPPALGTFLWADSAREALVLAVNLGGDTDTIGAMTGALAGAFWGLEGLPAQWLQELENGPQGRDYVLGLCRRALAAKSG